jgi:transposase InsO family protein
MQVFFYKNNQLVLIGERNENALYLLKLKPLPEEIFLKELNKQLDVGLGADIRASLITWHERLGHVNYHTLIKMVKTESTLGLNLTGNLTSPLDNFHRQPSNPAKNTISITRIGDLIHTDVWGPSPVTSIGGSKYFILFKDDFTGYLTVYFMTLKSEAPALFRLYEAMVLNQTENNIRTLRSDGGGEYFGKEFEDYLAKKGIRHKSSAPYTPSQNGVSERSNRTILNSARSMLLSSGLTPKLWAEAVSYSTYIRNRVLSRTRSVTPHEAWTGKKPNLSNLRTFGCKTFARVPITKKLDAKSHEGFYVGRSHTQNAARIFVTETRKILISNDFKVDETVYYNSNKSSQVYT